MSAPQPVTPAPALYPYQRAMMVSLGSHRWGKTHAMQQALRQMAQAAQGASRTLAEAQGKIRWQREPGGHSDFEWRICTLENGVFVDEKGQPQMVHRSPYTQEAWDRFCRTYGAKG